MIDSTPQAKRQRLAIIPESPPMPPLVGNAPATSPLISNPPTQVDDLGLEMSAVNAVVPLSSNDDSASEVSISDCADDRLGGDMCGEPSDCCATAVLLPCSSLPTAVV